MTQWFDNDDMWRIFYDCMFDADSFQSADQDCENLLKLCDFPGHNVLDLACGPGRHVAGFARRGLAVTGVDLSGFLLNQAAQHIDKEGLDATLVHADLLRYEPQKTFDLITNLFSSFGYYENPKDNQQVLNNAYRWLKPGGQFVLDVFSKEQAAMHIEPVHCTEYDNGDVRFERPLLIDNMNVYANEWILVREGQAYRWQYQHFIYSAQELQGRLEKAGFDDIHIYGSMCGDDYDMESTRLVLVARK
ncbi:class I SAM-dependent methyltransferase [Marinicella gelatinilytica]|uniref:class I SAM-dependent methyltransferase n=1 Tax=Marinicella gelatinilytica TaxID=2996017 RepID=UPI002260AC99|nr:class I SAM-dependent methyltransferase [Marinicella gelatinilytica]MCX7545701.1 class I SAM-dependent methyltransferase [Marinicella gelatinilytica]